MIEDEKSVRDVIQTMLEMLNYKVLVAANGQEAAQIFQEYRFQISIILMDLIMPIMDGPVFLKFLETQQCEAKILTMSGYPSESDPLKFNGKPLPRLQKPLKFSELAQSLGDGWENFRYAGSEKTGCVCKYRIARQLNLHLAGRHL